MCCQSEEGLCVHKSEDCLMVKFGPISYNVAYRLAINYVLPHEGKEGKEQKSGVFKLFPRPNPPSDLTLHLDKEKAIGVSWVNRYPYAAAFLVSFDGGPEEELSATTNSFFRHNLLSTKYYTVEIENKKSKRPFERAGTNQSATTALLSFNFLSPAN
ncbi:hypothetical protein OSTOST_05881 [Ostertagia ostertagi]